MKHLLKLLIDMFLTCGVMLLLLMATVGILVLLR